MTTTTKATMTNTEIDIITTTMLAAWGGEPLADIDSPEYATLMAALESLFASAQPADFQLLGVATARALLDYRQNGLRAQREIALAQRAARGGEMH